MSPLGLRAVVALPNLEYGNLESTPNPRANEPSWAASVQDYGGIRDAKLAKHYLTHTVQTFVDAGMCEGQSDMWRVFVPAVALDCPVVRQGMLVLAAVCLHHDSSADRSDEFRLRYLEAAEAHGKIFVKGSREKMQDFQAGLNSQDQDSILACSRLLCVLGFAFFRTHRKNGTTLADAAAWTWLHLLRGVKTSYLSAVESGQPIDEIFLKDMAPPSSCYQLTLQKRTGCQNPCFKYVQKSWQEWFDALQSTLDRKWSSLEDQRLQGLTIAINLLYDTTEQISSQRVENVFRIIFTWPAEIPRGFVDMLMEGFPPALAVYAHWLLLVVLVEDFWMIDDMGRAGIRDVIAMCSEADSIVRHLLIWPRKMLDMRMESADSVP